MIKLLLPFLFASSLLHVEPIPLELKFEVGEVLRYRETVEATGTMTFGGKSESVQMHGTRVSVFDVKSLTGTTATMSVSYRDIKASAKITKAPAGVSAKEKAEAEKNLTEQLKSDLSAGERTQTVSKNGTTTYKFAAGPNRYVLIENGSFLMLRLPENYPEMGQNWFLDLMQADPNAGEPIKVNFKLVGASMIGGEKAYKIAFYAVKTDTTKQGDTKGEASLVMRGFVNLGINSGKVLSGEVMTDVTQTLSAEGRTQTQTRKTIQTFEKI